MTTTTTRLPFFGQLNFRLTETMGTVPRGALRRGRPCSERIATAVPGRRAGARNTADVRQIPAQSHAALSARPMQQPVSDLGEGFRSGNQPEWHRRGRRSCRHPTAFPTSPTRKTRVHRIRIQGSLCGWTGFAPSAPPCSVTKVEGQQFFSFIGAISAQILTNIDEVELQGGETRCRVSAQPTISVVWRIRLHRQRNQGLHRGPGRRGQ